MEQMLKINYDTFLLSRIGMVLMKWLHNCISEVFVNPKFIVGFVADFRFHYISDYKVS